jgi:hypothetical protein
LTFDSRIPEEAALLARLDGLPEERHLEYIRALAVKGFLQERAESSQPKQDLAASRAGRSGRNERECSRNPPEPKTEPLKPATQLETPEVPADMTLASLKQLVG